MPFIECHIASGLSREPQDKTYPRYREGYKRVHWI